ncbi:MAG: alkaline phosphatase D family protein [Polyangiales bacterium]
MKLTRRALIKAATAATALTSACGQGPVVDDDANADFDADMEVDANPDDLDGGFDLDDGAVGDGSVDASMNDGSAMDASADAARDAASDARVDARTDAGTVPFNPDFRGVPERAGVFPYAVMAGDATDTSIIFWTKYEGTGPLSLRVLEMNGSSIVAVRFNGTVTVGAGGFVRVVVNGLRPNKQHKYAFLVGPTNTPTGRSAIGTVQTAFAPDTLAPIVFAGTSCSHPSARPHTVLAHAGSRTDLDFFIHLGDHIYADAGDNAVTLAEYRAKYQMNWESPGMRALHKSTGMYLTWDDHEVLNNWNPETFSASRLANARQAFFEHRATRRNSAAPNRIWRSFRWGRTAEIFVLDCRSERRPSTGTTYLSRTQMDWLKAGLASSPCVFKFILNSVPIVDRAGADSDNWNGYPSQRREILNHIVNNNIRGVLWLSGDVHFGGICKVEAAGAWSNVWEVIVGPSGSNRDGNPPLNDSQWPVKVLNNIHNYAVIRANPMTRTIEVEFINEAGDRVPGSRWSRTF